MMRLLGRKVSTDGSVPATLQAEVAIDMKKRLEAVWIKHRLGVNSIKMYDKQGCIFRVETIINDPSDFKSFRSPEGKQEVGKKWLPMR
ncbi:MAG: hypothetical protein HQL73_06730 [Magnetococcales bacterium]|nr:hypothetical protein [Magnetococcales bacterium]